MDRTDLGCFATVISADRPGNVAAMQAQVGAVTWCVPEDQAQDYRDAGAASVLPVGGRLTVQRNAALRLAWVHDLPCLQMDDDLVELVRLDPTHPKGRPSTIEEFCRVLLRGTERWRFFLGGVAPTTNAFFSDVGRGERFSGFVAAKFTVTRPCALFFDEAMRLKEDYDYSLQHMERYGGIYRNDELMPTFRFQTNAGGAQAYRTAELEQWTIRYLQRKWPGCFVPNKRRPNEVLLRIPKRPVSSR